VLEQTFDDIEIVVADDGSTDGTEETLAGFGDRLRYVRQENRRHDGAIRNLGIAASTGKYLAFVDSDDLWAPSKLEKQIALFHENPQFGMVYSDAWCFDGETGITKYLFHQLRKPHMGWIASSLLDGNFIPTSSVLIQRKVIETVGLFNEDTLLHLRSDWEMWLRVAARFQVGLVSEPLFGYRLHRDNSTRLEDPLLYLRSHLCVLRHACSFAPEIYATILQRAIAKQYLHTGGMCVATDRVSVARSMYAQAILCDPAEASAYAFLLATLGGSRLAGYLARVYDWRRRRHSSRVPLDDQSS